MQSETTRRHDAWPRRRRALRVRPAAAFLLVVLVALVVLVRIGTRPAAAQEPVDPAVELPELPVEPVPPSAGEERPFVVQQPSGPEGPEEPQEADAPQLTVDLADAELSGDGSGPLQIILLITIVALAPALLILVTSFTRIIIVLGLSRNALNLQGVPPNQVLIGLALFLTLFVMAPVLREANEDGLQPFLDGEISQGEAFERASEPFKEFMLGQVRDEDLALFIEMSGEERPASPDDVSLTTLVPAFVISELRAAFLIGFVVYVPFLIIDMVVSATLMSMGMVMLPPVTIALPFKLLLFVLVDGWRLLAESIVASFST